MNVFKLLPISKEEWETITKKKYTNQPIEDVVELYNEANNDSNEELVQCEYCGEYSKWGEFKVWECEECGKIFCDNCVKINTEYKILCKECEEEC